MPCVTCPETERTCRHLQQVAKRYLSRSAFSVVSLRDFFRDAFRPLDLRANVAASEGALLD